MRHFGTWTLILGMGVVGCTVRAGDPDSGDAGGGGDGGTGASGGTGSGGMSGSAGSSASGSGGAVSDPVTDILNDPAVQSALEDAADQGVDVATHVEKDAPDPTGYYSYALGVGTWVASGNGANVGYKTTAAELRADLQANGNVDTAMVSSFENEPPSSYRLETGYLLRGAGNEITLYGRRSFECTLGGSSYTVSQVYIWTGVLEAGTGDWVDQVQFTVTTATEGELTSDCEVGLVGDTEFVGGWAVAKIPIATKIGVEDLTMMCVDEGRGYIPTEFWTDSFGDRCECTTNVVVACD
jgi:hypothetical protein